MPAGRVRPARADATCSRRLAPHARSASSRWRPQSPSPFAGALLFDYVGAFMYEGDSPLAERRAAALSLDSTLLAELLGRVELRELLDADVIDHTERELQRLRPGPQGEGRSRASPTCCACSGPLHHRRGRRTVDRRSRAVARPNSIRANARCAVSFAGHEWWMAIEDASRLRDALGVPLPIGTPAAFIEPVDDPLGDLVSRYARTHGPFTIADAAARFGLGTAVARDVLRRLAHDKRVVEGEFRPGATGQRVVRRRGVCAGCAAARWPPRGRRSNRSAPRRSAASCPSWQHVGGGLRGIDGVATVVEQLAGVPIPASASESLILRVAGARLLPGHARRTHLHRRGAVVGRGQHLRQGRLGVPAPRRRRHRSR